MTGKEKCELLKSIRKNIAEMNGIEYYPEQCDHEGKCPGFCPRCDMDASYLMKELKKKEAAGSPIRTDTESLVSFESLAGIPVENEEEILMGKPEPLELDGNIRPLQGDIVEPVGHLMGDVPLLTNKENVNFVKCEQKDSSEIDPDSVDKMCHGCSRYNTITVTENGVCCSCLSEYFFMAKLRTGHCSMKK